MRQEAFGPNSVYTGVSYVFHAHTGTKRMFHRQPWFWLVIYDCFPLQLQTWSFNKAFQACINFLSYNETHKMKRKCVTIWQHQSFPLVLSRDESFRLVRQKKPLELMSYFGSLKISKNFKMDKPMSFNSPIIRKHCRFLVESIQKQN